MIDATSYLLGFLLGLAMIPALLGSVILIQKFDLIGKLRKKKEVK